MAYDVDAWGIQLGYHDIDGNYYPPSGELVATLRRAMGADDPTAPPPQVDNVWVVGHGDEPYLIGPVELELEDGSQLRVEGRLPLDLPIGYHTLHALYDGVRGGAPTHLIVSPRSCKPPPVDRVWGLSAQLYSARSRESWGIGDLADLRSLGEWVTSHGGATLLVNPLDAPTPVEPVDPSPYFPGTRLFHDPVYLRVDEIDGAGDVDLSDLRAQGLAANDDRHLDRDAARARVVAAARRIFDHQPRVDADPGFVTFVADQEPELTAFAVFGLLADDHGTGWREWPQDLRHPDGDAVADYVAAHERELVFQRWLQWQIDVQLAAAGRAVPLLRDLPVGFDPDGSDAWMWQDLLADGITIGAPPDPLGPQGQDWRLPTFVPWKLRAAGYVPIARTLRAAFRHAAGLRIDHVLGLFRLFWIPPGGSAADGTYVRLPASDLLDVLAIESRRAGAWVVGEDLGTVEDGVREQMAARNLLRYQVFLFEDAPPTRWADLSLASVTTHDLPTVAGLWTGADLDEQRELGLEPDSGMRERFLSRIERQTPVTRDDDVTAANRAVHALLGRGEPRVVLAQLEDLAGVAERINVPGTSGDQRANWSRALPRPLEDLLSDDDAAAVAEGMAAGR